VEKGKNGRGILFHEGKSRRRGEKPGYRTQKKDPKKTGGKESREQEREYFFKAVYNKRRKNPNEKKKSYGLCNESSFSLDAGEGRKRRSWG